MEIYKNKSSGKYFIYIEDTDTDDGALFVSPGCKVIPLQLNLFFDEPEEGGEDDFLSDGLITKTQLERYRQYNEDRLKESGNWFEDIEGRPPRPSGVELVDPNDKQREKEPDMIERMAKDIKHNKC
jgi:hypothetical protein